ncbi:hypothetical protein HK096_006248 [Nowakowskiella sp. JEL0078]|nr:hypothetical protein HK096_006248 [Nowakowskiella sp. JEL0078]
MSLPYFHGDPVTVECPVLTQDGEPTTDYEPGPICLDTGLPLSFPFATDARVQCSIPTDERTYKHLEKVIVGKAAWMCRIPLTKNKTFYVPFNFNLWGAVEPSHVHMMNHFNFVFHVMDGFFLGATAYALRDQVVKVEPDAGIVIHGPVRWFIGHTYDMIADPEDDEEETRKKLLAAGPAQFVAIKKSEDTKINPESQTQQPTSPPPHVIKLLKKKELPTLSKLMNAVSPALVSMYCILSAGAATGVCLLIYIGWLKPALIKEYRKLK